MICGVCWLSRAGRQAFACAHGFDCYEDGKKKIGNYEIGDVLHYSTHIWKLTTSLTLTRLRLAQTMGLMRLLFAICYVQFT